jgi:hypothetical protein
VSVDGNEPSILTASSADGGELEGLPFGPFDALAHRTMEIGLRSWVEEQTGLRLGYVEQLYTFGDRGRHAQRGDTDVHVASVGYLALTRGGQHLEAAGGGCDLQAVVPLFSVEDWRDAPPPMIAKKFSRAGDLAAQSESRTLRALSRGDRVRLYFGTHGAQWDEERVLDRYELLYEAGLIEEARRDERPAALARKPCPHSARPCALTIAGFSPPPSLGCAQS